MKIVIDKYGREWLKKYGTYTLLNVSQLAILNLKKEVVVLLLAFNVTFAQSSIVAAGNQTETFGETFPIMQTVQEEVQVNLGTPTFELPEPPKPKPVIKKKSFFEKLIASILKLFKKK